MISIDKIQEAKESLGDDNAQLIADILNVENYSEREMKGCCPFHAEKTPSFIYNRKKFSFHCFGCGENVDIITAMQSTGKTFKEATEELERLSGVVISDGKSSKDKDFKYPVAVHTDNKNKAYKYLKLRGISKETADSVAVEQDEKGNLVFQYFDIEDTLTNVKYRPSHKVEKGSVKTWFQKDCDKKHILFNMNRINPTQPLLITEGEIDCMTAIECGFKNAVSVPMGAGNTQWIEECWEWLEKFDTIIICADNDKAGEKMKDECVTRLGAWRTQIVQLPEKTERIFEDGTVKIVKISDLNEVLYFFGKDKVKECLTNTKLPEIKGAYDYSDVEGKNAETEEGVYTGLYALDHLINKLAFGTLTIVTGEAGSGKSSFLNGVMATAIEDGIKVFQYSGELLKEHNKAWITPILAGQFYRTELHLKNDVIAYTTPKEIEKKIDEYYRGMRWGYDTSHGNSIDDILDVATQLVRRYGVKLVTIDNLSCIDINVGRSSSEFQEQKNITNKLREFAKEFKVAVIFVVHPRKKQNGYTGGIERDDVGGSGAITNLAHVTISLHRVTPKEKSGIMNQKGDYITPPVPYDVTFKVLKQRNSSTYQLVCGVYYDVPSKRFFSNLAELRKQYSWDTADLSQKELPYPHPAFENFREIEEEIYGA